MESVFSHFIQILCLCITMVWRALDLINIPPAAVNRSLTPATDKQQDQCDPQQTDRASFSPAHTLLCIPAAHVDSQPLCSELSHLQHSGPMHKRTMNIHDPQRVNLNNFGWPSVTFPLAPQQGFHTHFRWVRVQKYLDNKGQQSVFVSVETANVTDQRMKKKWKRHSSQG